MKKIPFSNYMRKLSDKQNAVDGFKSSMKAHELLTILKNNDKTCFTIESNQIDFL